MGETGVVRTGQSVGVAVSLVASLMFLGVVAVAISLMAGQGFRWLWLATAVMFLAQAIGASLSAYRRSSGRGQADPRTRLMLPVEYRTVGAASILATALFLVAGFGGEGWSFSLLAAAGCAVWGLVHIGIAWRL